MGCARSISSCAGNEGRRSSSSAGSGERAEWSAAAALHSQAHMHPVRGEDVLRKQVEAMRARLQKMATALDGWLSRSMYICALGAVPMLAIS